MGNPYPRAERRGHAPGAATPGPCGRGAEPRCGWLTEGKDTPWILRTGQCVKHFAQPLDFSGTIWYNIKQNRAARRLTNEGAIMNVIGYTRVSTGEQATEGVSLAMQEEKIRAYCIARDWDCTEIIVDAGASAASRKRPGLQQVVAKCRAGKTEGVVVLKLDRLTRSVRDLGYLIDDVFEKNGVAFTSVQDNFDTTTANGRLILNILGTVAQWERDIIAERTADALRHLKQQGQRYGQVPFGYLLADDDRTLLADPDAQAAITNIIDWRAGGATLQEIADRLQEAGVPTQDNGRWQPTTVWRVLRRTEAEVA